MCGHGGSVARFSLGLCRASGAVRVVRLAEACAQGGRAMPVAAGAGGAAGSVGGGGSQGGPVTAGVGTAAPVLAAEVEPERPEHVCAALKHHVIRERKRKKEEQEAEVEEERQRKEREARERQDVMTLGETREQIQQLEQKLTKLKEEKHQLFLQLKKVLNEDDNRKKQFKDSNEMMSGNNMNGMVQGGNMNQTNLFLSPAASQGNPNRLPLMSHMLNKVAGGMKRGRSPSPPYAQPQTGPHGGTPYMHHPHHKHQHASPYQGPTQKIEDGRNREMARAVLWTKSTQYSSGGGEPSYYPLMYRHPPQQHHPPSKQVHHSLYHVDHEIKKEPLVQMGHDQHQPNYLSQPPPCLPSPSTAPPDLPRPVTIRHAPQPQMINAPPPIHQSVNQMQHNNVQNTKPGGIISGYPVRQQNPSVQNPNMYPNRHRY